MRKNVLIVVIDGLSKWYIDQCKSEKGFFSNLEKNSYSANNMFSEGPFTEAATRGLWASQDAMRGKGYLAEAYFEYLPFYDLFHQNGYFIYMGELVPFFTHKMHVDNVRTREKCEVRGFDHIWRSRLEYFISLKRGENYREEDNWKIEFLLEQFFENYQDNTTVEYEKNKYYSNKKEYILDILDNCEKSSFFMAMDSSLYYACRYKNITNFKKACFKMISEEELKFVSLAKYKNLEFLFKINQGLVDKLCLEKELGGTANRCIQSNNDLISHMRGGYDDTPRLCRELKDFLEWFDNYESDAPFLAYIHNFDFHYPENFINSQYNNNCNEYCKEVNEKIEELKGIECCNMSVSKQLSILNIERNLKEFWEQLKARKVFENTYVILTADHGIANFMNPIGKKDDERWNYTKMNFQIPFYMQGPDIVPVIDNELRSAKDILPTLACKCELDFRSQCYDGKIINSSSSKIMSAVWINGIPDLSRKKLRMGIRNEKYSITYEAFVSQFFSSGKILGVYNLQNDPNEVINLSSENIQDEEYQKLLCTMTEKWFETVFSILTDRNSPYQFQKKYKFLLSKYTFYKDYNQRLEKISWKEADLFLKDKEIILFGCGETLYSFIEQKKFIYPIIEIWDNDESKCGKYVLGHKVCKPNKERVTCNRVVIITNRYEIEAIEQLNRMEVEHYFIGALFY